MMIKLVKPFLFIFLLILITYSCVKEENESNTSSQERILKAYIEVLNQDRDNDKITPTASGIYVLDSTPGTGASIGDSAYAYIRYSIKYLDEIYLFSTYDSVAKQLGTYAESNCYGTWVWPVGMGTLASGREEILRMMKIGGKTTAILPPLLLDEESGAFINSGEGTNKIFDIELDTFVVNMNNYQTDQLEDYASKHYPDLKPLDNGFYFYQIQDGGFNEPKDSIPNEDVLDVRYIGRLLDGTVFDTNIKDSALKYDLYTGSDPKPETVNYYKDFDEMKENNEMVEGFLLAIHKMGGYKDKCVTFFNSDYGYGDGGKNKGETPMGNQGIPGYYPLFFEIWIEDEPDND